MPRHLFGGSPSDYAMERVGNQLLIRPGAAGTAWDNATAGTQITDLTDTAGAPISTITAGDDGSVAFYGPNNVTSLFVDFGFGRRYTLTAVDVGETLDSKFDKTGGTVSGPVTFEAPITAPNLVDIAGGRVFMVTGAAGTGLVDDRSWIQAALDLAGAAGGGTVVIPGGYTYGISTYLVAPAGVRIWAHGATLLAIGNTGLIRNYAPGETFTAYTGPGNITIEGGVWDANASDGSAGLTTNVVNAFTLGHGHNFIIRDATIRNVSGAHAIEINASRGVRILNCRFEGFRDNTSDSSRGYSEAVQMDYAIAGSGSAGVNDGTACKSVRVEGCYFGPSERLPGFGRAVGSHTSVNATTWHENIQVVNNIVEGTGQEGIRAYGWKNAVIANNIISGTGSACIIVTGPDPAVAGYSLACQGITVKDNLATGAPGTSPLRVIGFATARPTGVKITGNTVTNSAATAIYVSQAAAPSVTGNTVVDSGSSAVYAINCTAPHIATNTCVSPGSTAIGVETCTGGLVTGNEVEGTDAAHGIYVAGGSDVTVSANRVNGAKGSGIRVTTSAARCRVLGNTVLRGGVSGSLGIDVTASATACLVIGNDLTGSAWPAGTALSLLGTGLVVDWAGGTTAPGQNLVS